MTNSVERPKGLFDSITLPEAKEDGPSEEAAESEPSGQPEKKDLLYGILSDTAQANNTSNIVIIPHHLIDAFSIEEDPFDPYDEEEMNGLTESIRHLGVLEPVIVRARGIRYELLAGHHRKEGNVRAGNSEIISRIMDCDDDTARMIFIDTNLKRRKNLKPVEIGRAYKLQMEIIRRQAGETDSAADPSKKTRDKVAERNKTSPRNVSRYLRILELIPELQTQTAGELSVRAACELSYLNEETQIRIVEIMDEHNMQMVSMDAAAELRKIAAESKSELSDSELTLLIKGKPLRAKAPGSQQIEPFKVAFSAIRKQYKGMEEDTINKIRPEELEAVIATAIETYLRQLDG